MNGTTIILRLSTTLRGRCRSSSPSPITNLFKSISQSQASFSSPKRIPGFSRLPVEASCLMSMLPLHSAIASARLQSVLSVDSQTWCLVPQGMSMPL